MFVSDAAWTSNVSMNTLRSRPGPRPSTRTKRPVRVVVVCPAVRVARDAMARGERRQKQKPRHPDVHLRQLTKKSAHVVIAFYFLVRTLQTQAGRGGGEYTYTNWEYRHASR
jgi:hypothetical protein